MDREQHTPGDTNICLRGRQRSAAETGLILGRRLSQIDMVAMLISSLEFINGYAFVTAILILQMYWYLVPICIHMGLTVVHMVFVMRIRNNTLHRPKLKSAIRTLSYLSRLGIMTTVLVLFARGSRYRAIGISFSAIGIIIALSQVAIVAAATVYIIHNETGRGFPEQYRPIIQTGTNSPLNTKDGYMHRMLARQKRKTLLAEDNLQAMEAQTMRNQRLGSTQTELTFPGPGFRPSVSYWTITQVKPWVLFVTFHLQNGVLLVHGIASVAFCARGIIMKNECLWTCAMPIVSQIAITAWTFGFLHLAQRKYPINRKVFGGLSVAMVLWVCFGVCWSLMPLSFYGIYARGRVWVSQDEDYSNTFSAFFTIIGGLSAATATGALVESLYLIWKLLVSDSFKITPTLKCFQILRWD